MLHFSPASNSAGLPPQPGFWDKFKPGQKKEDLQKPSPQMNMNHQLARQRLLTLACGDMETIRMLPNTFGELMACSCEWVKAPPEAIQLRVPVEYASLSAARLVMTPYIYISSEETYQIAAMGVHGLRVEIVYGGPGPEDEPPPPPPPPILEMEGIFNLELVPGQFVSLDVNINSDEMDMARMEDGTTVDGSFWGKLDIVHSDDVHKLEFTGTKLADQEISTDLLIDSRVMGKLAVAAKPATAKCSLSLLSPDQVYCDVMLTLSPYWKLGTSWPKAEPVSEGKVKYFLRANPGGALEHFESQSVTTALYYEAIPDPTMMEPTDFIAPRNGYAMSFEDFVPHITNVLNQLGMSMFARTNFINNNLAAFSCHHNIAYRFLPPARIAQAIDISVTADPCVFTRLFLVFRGLSDDDAGMFAGAGEKEANQVNWREIVGWTEDSKDSNTFRVLETSVLEVG